MARNPQSRDELHRRLAESIGSEAADTLMEALPPHSWDELATKDMVLALKSDVEAVKSDVEAVKSDVEAVKSDVGLLRIGFERLDTKIDQFEARVDLKFEATEHRLTATFRQELMRTVVVSQVATVVTVATAIIAAAKLL